MHSNSQNQYIAILYNPKYYLGCTNIYATEFYHIGYYLKHEHTFFAGDCVLYCSTTSFNALLYSYLFHIFFLLATHQQVDSIFSLQCLRFHLFYSSYVFHFDTYSRWNHHIIDKFHIFTIMFYSSFQFNLFCSMILTDSILF